MRYDSVRCEWTYSLVAFVVVLFASTGLGEERRLTHDGLLKRDPIYVDSGRAIVYSVRAASPRLVLMRLDVKSGQTARLHPDSNLVEFRPAISSSGQIMAFQRMTGNDVCRLVVRNLETQIDSFVATGKKTSFNVALSPDGKRLVYNLSGQLYQKDIASGREQAFADSSGRDDWPAWSPDGKHVAFSSSRDGDYDVYVADASGDVKHRLTATAGLDIRPSWCPTGRRIAFTSNRDRNYEVYVVEADGSGVRRITTSPERDDYPSWHPDGKRLVYVRERNGRYDLCERTVAD